MSLLELSSKERSTLRAAAHALKPIVQIGDNGLTPAVLKEIDSSLTAHGLIKVRVAGDDRENRLAILENICSELNCAKVAHLGKILTIFRPSVQHTHLLADTKPALQRSQRHPNEEYTPKKLAAAGKSIKDKKRKPNTPKGNDTLVSKPRKPSIPVRKGVSSVSSARKRIGSALTLRAGRRTR